MTVISICQFSVFTHAFSTTYLFTDDLSEEKMSDDELDDPRERLLKAHRCSKPSKVKMFTLVLCMSPFFANMCDPFHSLPLSYFCLFYTFS